jgi:hypothetical protein
MNGRTAAMNRWLGNAPPYPYFERISDQSSWGSGGDVDTLVLDVFGDASQLRLRGEHVAGGVNRNALAHRAV